MPTKRNTVRSRSRAIRMTPKLRAVLSRIVARAKRSIVADVKDGTVPRSVRTIGGLGSYVDQNVYFLDANGDFDPEVEALQVDLGRDGVDSQPMYDFLTLAMDRVEAWMKAGGLKRIPVASVRNPGGGSKRRSVLTAAERDAIRSEARAILAERERDVWRPRERGTTHAGGHLVRLPRGTVEFVFTRNEQSVSVWAPDGHLAEFAVRGTPRAKRKVANPSPIYVPADVDLDNARGSFSFGGKKYRGEPWEHVEAFQKGRPIDGGPAVTTSDGLAWVDGKVYRMISHDWENGEIVVSGIAHPR